MLNPVVVTWINKKETATQKIIITHYYYYIYSSYEDEEQKENYWEVEKKTLIPIAITYIYYYSILIVFRPKQIFIKELYKMGYISR